MAHYNSTFSGTQIDANLTLASTSAQADGVVLSYNIALYGTDSTLSSYSATNGVYLNGNSSGWLELNGDGSQRNHIKIYGDTNPLNGINFNTGATEVMRIDSTGNVGIGTSSPTTKIHVKSDSNDSLVNTIGLSPSTTDNIQGGLGVVAGGQVSINGANIVTATTAGTERLRIDSSGNVGIGTTSPAEPLHVQEGGGSGATASAGTIAFIDGNANTKVTIASGTTSTGRINFGRSTDNDAGSIIYDHNDNSLAAKVSGSEAMRIDSSGNVGVGVTTLGAPLQVDKAPVYNTMVANFGELVAIAGYQRGVVNINGRVNGVDGNAGLSLVARNAGNANWISGLIEYDRDDSMTFATGGAATTAASEAMRIDSAGTVLVAKTAADNTTVGHRFEGNGFVSHVRDGAEPLVLNRLTSEGTIEEFRKDGTSVGSIGTANGDLYVDGGPSAHAGLRFQATGILPRHSGGNSDGAVDIGQGSNRFRDLSLSGGVYLGGTAAANKLDDYEEGTASMKWSDGTNDSSVIACKYTKVGRLVTVSGYASGNISGLTGSATIQLAGFPFTFSEYGSFAIKTRNINSPTGCISLVGFHGPSGAFAGLSFIVDNGNYVDVTVADMSVATNDCYFDITYQTS